MKMLIVKPSSLGDVIHALPFLKAMKDAFPDSRIDWLISSNLREILEDNPLVNELIAIEKDSWKKPEKLAKTLSEFSALRKYLKARHYDIVADLQGLLRSSIISFLTPSVLKVGFANSREGSKYFYNRKISVNGNLHAVDKNLAIAKALGASPGKAEFPIQISNASKEKVKELTGGIKEYAVIIPSARWFTKRWPAENFAALMRKIPIPCVITGQKSDRELFSNFNNIKSGKVINLCGKTGLKELSVVIAGAKVVVTNDSGPMHIAAALDKNIVALFGPTDPEKTGPYGWKTNKKFHVITASVSCSPCRKRKCSDLTCMKSISVKSVLEAVRKLI